MKIVARDDLKEYPTQPATDTIDYVATDTWGNTATSTRTIIVESAASTTAQ